MEQQFEPVNQDRTINILFVGDVVGRSGRKAIKEQLSGLRKEFDLSCVVVNGENSANGIGITRSTAEEIFKAGADVITNGNHVWGKKEIYSYIGEQPRLLRPLNYPKGVPGKGSVIFEADNGARIGVVSLLGRTFMDPVECPFHAVDNLLKLTKLGRDVDVWLVDMHGEATSEKVAMGYHLDGRVSAVLGTHTHIPTADQRVLKGGTGYMTDVGMTGPYDSVIGMRYESVMKRFLTRMPSRFEPATGESTLCGVVVRIRRDNGFCQSIVPVRRGGELNQI